VGSCAEREGHARGAADVEAVRIGVDGRMPVGGGEHDEDRVAFVHLGPGDDAALVHEPPRVLHRCVPSHRTTSRTPGRGGVRARRHEPIL
jgi:hypothetical protein